MDFSRANDQMQRMFYYILQNRMGEQSLQRQMRYLQASNKLYGERAAEGLRAEEESYKRRQEFSHGLDMEEKAQGLIADLSKLDPIKQRQSMYFLEKDPVRKKAIEDELGSIAALVGDIYELHQSGRPIPAQMLTDAQRGGLTVDQIQDLVNRGESFRGTIMTNLQGAENRASREGIAKENQRLGWARLEAEKNKPPKGAAGPDKDKTELNKNIGGLAKELRQDLTAQLKSVEQFEDKKPEAKRLRAILKRASQIQSRAATGGYADVASAQPDLDYLNEIIGEEPAGEEEEEAPLDLKEQKIEEVAAELVKRGYAPDVARRKAEAAVAKLLAGVK